jgi:hypothetical protein
MNVLLQETSVASFFRPVKWIRIDFILRVNSMAKIPISFCVKAIIRALLNTLPNAYKAEAIESFWDDKDCSLFAALAYFWGGMEYRFGSFSMSGVFLDSRSFVSGIVDRLLLSNKLQGNVFMSMIMLLFLAEIPGVQAVDFCEMKKCVSQLK